MASVVSVRALGVLCRSAQLQLRGAVVGRSAGRLSSLRPTVAQWRYVSIVAAPQATPAEAEAAKGEATGEEDPSEQRPVVKKSSSRPRVVVLGTGWGSFPLARNLDKKLFDVHVVSPRNHMVFTPLLTSTAVGTLEFRAIAEPIRSSVPNLKFHLGKCRSIDPVARRIKVVTKPEKPSAAVVHGTVPSTVYDLEYDVLVMGVGARANTFGIQGVEEHVQFLKELSDARGIRKGITECLEAAAHDTVSEEERKRLLHWVVVGGGPTGVEFSGELSDFIHQDLRRYYPELAEYMKVTLIEGRGILGSFDESLREYALKALKQGKVNMQFGANVQEVTARSIVLDDGTVVPYGLCVWSTGVGPRKLTNTLDKDTFGKTRAQRLMTDSKLRVYRASSVSDEATWAAAPATVASDEDVFPGIYAIGDCADVQGGHYAPIAQVAERQGKYLATQLNKLVLDDVDFASGAAPLDSFEYKHIGSLAYVGSYAAVSDFTRSAYVKGAKLTGFASWLFWRSAYLSQQGSWRNRLQVPLDWLRTLVFGRDINSF